MPKLTIEKSAVPDGGAAILQAGERLKVALFRVGDRFAAINNRCPHAGGSLAEGKFDGTIVNCPLHGFKVDVWRGIGNAGTPVKTFPVEVVGDQVVIVVPD